MKSFYQKLTRTHVLLLVFIEILGGIFFSVSSFLLLVKFRGEVFEKEFTLFDNSIMSIIYSLRTPALTSIMKLFSFLGYELIVMVGVLLVILFLLEKHKREAVMFALIVGMAPIISTVLKNLNARPRPYGQPLITLSDYSFPSGHAMTSFVFYATISYFVYHFTKNKLTTYVSILLSLTLILLIGISRVYLGVHYPTDIIAGYLGGMCWFSSLMLVDKTLDFFELFREAKSPSQPL
jgi:undecaprenyl-diphosphatase